MLGQLHIKNIGIIDEVTVNFDDNLNIITGETGAGKSLIIDSINAITGSRISKELVRTGADMAFVEACFFDADEEEIILAREIYQNGRSICKINGKMATVSELKEVGGKLIDIHGQHDNQSLLNPKTHLELLDNFAGTSLYKLKEEYSENLKKYKEVTSQIKKNYGDEQERARRLDLLNYQIQEIEDANLKASEEEELLERRKILLNSEKIAKALNGTHIGLEDTVLEALNSINREIGSIADLNEKYNTISTQLEETYNLQDISSTLTYYLSEIDFSENEQAEIEERLDLFYNMKRKYGNTIEDILTYYEKIKEEKHFLENSEEIIHKLKNEQQELEKILCQYATKITEKRKECAEEIEKKINEQMQDLEMKKAFLKFEFTKSDTFLENGKDEVQLLICTNVGDALKPLSKIASGGEISRVMLAIKTVLGDYDSVPTMIFDEIDTGISGQAGKAVAEKLKIISKKHQVICVTHLPAIVATGSANYYIDKIVEKSQTKTKIKRLNEDETVREIARVIAGNDISDAVIEHAKELRKNKADIT